jgi:hypothetical protein
LRFADPCGPVDGCGSAPLLNVVRGDPLVHGKEAVVITDEETDQSPQGKVTNLMAGTAGQITDRLKHYKEAGMTMPLLWPPFADVPVAKTLDDLKRLKEEIMPKVDAA